MAYRLCSDFKAHVGTSMKGRFHPLFIVVFGILLLAIFSSACSNDKSRKPVSAPIPVIVSTVIQKTVFSFVLLGMFKPTQRLQSSQKLGENWYVSISQRVRM